MVEEDNGATAALFTGKDPVVYAIYERLLDAIQPWGPFTAEAKKTSIHLVRTSGFAGVHPRNNYLYLNLRLDYPLVGPRIAKIEPVSKNPWHNEIRLDTPDEVDAELLAWLHAAYMLG